MRLPDFVACAREGPAAQNKMILSEREFRFENYQVTLMSHYETRLRTVHLNRNDGMNPTIAPSHYANDLSFWLDLKIIFLTVPSLLTPIYDTRFARKFSAKMHRQGGHLVPLHVPCHNAARSSSEEADC
jgi:hypothetical protein